MPPASDLVGMPAHRRSRAVAQSLLGGRTARAFLRRHWQKEALLIRAALPGFTGVVAVPELFAMAGRDDVEARLVQRDGKRWSVEHGPFPRRTLLRLPPRNWTLLVQGLNLHLTAADALLRRFAFLPYARLDDLMVSYAAPGGGVGPHADSYDVFLLQGGGRRRWRYGPQADPALRTDTPLKILRRFRPSCDETLGPGDMLYLPPEWGHEGIALDACTTYSIGFRAPAATELATAFLDHLRDTLVLPGRYADPDLAPTTEPARIDAPMQRKVARMLRAVRWTPDTVERFLGGWLSEPKPSVFFNPPARPLPAPAFRRRAARGGIHLDVRTLLLYDETRLYLNGTALPWPGADRSAFARLANARALAGRTVASLAPAGLRLLHDWYRNGYVRLDTP